MLLTKRSAFIRLKRAVFEKAFLIKNKKIQKNLETFPKTLALLISLVYNDIGNLSKNA